MNAMHQNLSAVCNILPHVGGVCGFLTSTLYEMEVLLKVCSLQCHM